jgi:hypothetical protein
MLKASFSVLRPGFKQRSLFDRKTMNVPSRRVSKSLRR